MINYKNSKFEVSSILKNNLYLNGLLVSDKLYETLKNSEYNGYRTTEGIFLKLGATLSQKEFEMNKLEKKKKHLLNNHINIKYEDYLKNREYTTTKLIKISSINIEKLENKTYFILKENPNGEFFIEGQFVYNQEKYSIKLEDCGIFVQENYNDDAVALQAGGIRLRASICENNCISGCTFCDFGKGANNYDDQFFNDERKKYIIHLIDKNTSKEKAQTLFITGGNPSLRDLTKWTTYVRACIKKFKQNVPNGKVDVMLTPRGFDKYVYDSQKRYEEYKKYLKYLKNLGANTISPNIELWEQQDLERFCPANKIILNTTKSEIGHMGYIDFIKAGIEVFGKYNVRTSLIVGLNSKENIKKAIDYLIPLGCYVVLSPFKSPNEKLKKFEPEDYDLIELCEYLKKVLEKYLNKFLSKEKNMYMKRICNSLNAHNSHNTANLCSKQNLDILEQKMLYLGKDSNIINSSNKI